ncbi:endonuclease MutS2 [Rhodohalobacter mucosus]|uniref:Endonuclease MutS2 n=1 Tax=Rhodohalobacter mucosus TaxID=2079485 RepID=A0A316TSE1_9BACT|nr:endonuclease MutS2 [Rhodohalobacter mucosus]PWN06788.1 endonuclease MutS2 [Rhodohalobacter mucosus]
MSIHASVYPDSTLRKTGFETVREATLRKCFTLYGKEEISSFKPFSDSEKVRNELGRSSEWMHLLQSGLNHPLTNLDDVRPHLRESRAGGSLLPLESFPIILANARQARIIKQFFVRTEVTYKALQEITNRLVNLKPLEEAIQRVVTDRGELKDDASSELKRIRGKLNRERSRLRSTIQRVMKDLAKKDVVSDEGATIRAGRMVIPVQAEFKRKVEGFVHDVSSTGQTVYIEPVQALQINNEIRQLELEEEREIEKIIRQLTTEVRTYREELELNCGYIGELDAIHCRVSLGLDLDGVIPLISDSGKLNLIRARNPNLLLKQIGSKDNKEPVIPLNLEMSGTERALIITGPNAGGKSVAMKTVGLISAMLQCGYPVPVQPDSEIPVISGLFVDIGDEQSIENDLSTFSSRLDWMKHVLEDVPRRSLVLIDEAGSGTDPEEGGALFQAFIEAMIDSNSRVIATTHHGSLKVFAHEHQQVINGAMEFNQESLSPTYRFKKGVPGSSYAFEIADRMNLPGSMMKRARSLLGEQRDKMGDLLVNLEKQMQESEELMADYKERLSNLEKREKVYIDKASNFENKRKKILERAYKDAEEIMKGANSRIEEAVQKIVELGKEDKDAIREARSDVRDAKKEISLKRSLAEEEKKPVRTGETPAVGDTVVIGDSDTTGELIDLSGKQATVLVNGMKIKSKLNKLVKTEPPKKKKKSPAKQRSYGGSEAIDLSVKPRLDLRGKRGDEAIKELTLYLDKAVARGLNEVEIVHGKGEGILHKLVHEYLEQRKEVKEFDIAPWESGGSGCTIVKL